MIKIATFNEEIAKIQQIIEKHGNIYLGYARVSSDEQVQEGLSMTNQLKQLNKYYQDRSIKNYFIVTCDEGKTAGEKTKRKGYLAIEEFMKLGLVKELASTVKDRIHRNLLNSELMKKISQENNVKITSLTQNIDTTTADGNFQDQIQGSISEWFKNKIRDDSFRVIKSKLENGEWCTKIPFGYKDKNKNKIDKVTKKKIPAELIIDQEEAKIVIKAHQLVSKTNSIRPVARELNITPSVLINIINHINKGTYHGFISRNGKKYKGKHEPILTTKVT